jgi:hypothetical protein
MNPVSRYRAWRQRLAAERQQPMDETELRRRYWIIHDGRRWDRIFMALMVAGGALFYLSSSANDTRVQRQADRIERVSKANQTRDQAALVGVCGITNINRIGIQNMLSGIGVEKPFVLTDKWPAFLDEQHASWTPVECRALVPNELGVQLCLQYPPTNDPETGKPTPTTIDPINEKACDK